MSKKNTDHVVLRNNSMFCSHCGRELAVPMPIEIPVFIAMGNSFSKEHANCEKTWKQPAPDQDNTVRAKANFWWKYGERGLSSEYMYRVLSNEHFRLAVNWPRDPDDFKRCHGLLEMVPEWRLELQKMADTSEVWKNLVDNWGKLTDLLEEQMRTKKPNGMYEFMKTLGC